MPYTIRHQVYETNSSSTHSFSIGPFKKSTDYGGFMRITGGQFGWKWDKFNDVENKLNYYLTYVRGELPEGFEDVLKSKILDSIIIFEYAEDSYIDHQSCDAIHFGNTNEEIVDFILNRNAWIFTGNDNSNPPLNFYVLEELPYFVTLEDCEGYQQYNPANENKSYDDAKPGEYNLYGVLQILFNTYTPNENLKSEYDDENPSWNISYDNNALNKRNKTLKIKRSLWDVKNHKEILLEEKLIKYKMRKNPNYKEE